MSAVSRREGPVGGNKELIMSVLISAKFKGDTMKFKKALANRADDLVKSAEAARAAGAIHHRFGVGDDFVLVVDEWETVDQFEKFISRPEMQQMIADLGAAEMPPEVIVTE